MRLRAIKLTKSEFLTVSCLCQVTRHDYKQVEYKSNITKYII